MKYIFGFLMFFVICSVFALSAGGVSMTLENDQNFPAYMVVGGPSASVTYDITNTSGGAAYIIPARITELPKTSTIKLLSSSKNNCYPINNNQTCKLVITLDPKSSASIQDIVHTGPMIYLPIGPNAFQKLTPLEQNQLITVRVFPNTKTKLSFERGLS